MCPAKTDDNKLRVAAVIVAAAGRGERAGQSVEGPKQYRRIGGEAVLMHTVRAFLGCPSDTIKFAVVIHKEDGALICPGAGRCVPRKRRLLPADQRGRNRPAWAYWLWTMRGIDHVLIHDGVRPFIAADLLERVIFNLTPHIGVLPVLAVSDTLKAAGPDAMVSATVPRAGLYAAQTPQAFPYQPILDAHNAAYAAGRSDFTDDSAIAEWHSLPVRIVEGSADNTKLTWAKDIEMADDRLSQKQFSFPDVRTGNGYDVHAFEPGDGVWLAGVFIPHDRELSGHSDADVALHALTDALLATRGAGDIGTHFPPSDPQWKGAASHIFVEHAVKIVKKRGWRKDRQCGYYLNLRGTQGWAPPRSYDRSFGKNAWHYAGSYLYESDDK